MSWRSRMVGEHGEAQALAQLLGEVDAVLFDFDGPVCDLFGAASTAPIAEEVKVRARQEWGRLDPAVEACDDSHGILRRLGEMLDRHPPSVLGGPPGWADAIVTEHEYASGHATTVWRWAR